MKSFSCLNHTQQLAIMDTFKEFKTLEDGMTMLEISDKCKKLAEHIKRADPARKLLLDECQAVGHHPKSIPQANDTRWDSRHSNMEGVLYHEECLVRLARQRKLIIKDSNGDTVNLIPTLDEFRLIEAGVEMLKLCKDTTKIFEQEKVPTMPHLLERMYNVDQELEEIIKDDNKSDIAKDFASELRTQLQERFPEFGADRELSCFGNYLNPSIKGIHLKLVDKFESTKVDLENKLVTWKSSEQMEEEEDQDQEHEEVEPRRKLSPTEILKQQMKRKEQQQGGRVGAKVGARKSRASKVFKEPFSAFRRECQSYELLTDAPPDVDQLE